MSKTGPELGSDEIKEILSGFGVRATNEQASAIRDYISILLKWNKLVSLTSVTEPSEIAARHFGESMFASTLLPVENCRLADVGSGAGFPGLALKILCPSLEVRLIESNNKKSTFLSEIVRTLKLTNVEILPARFEDLRIERGSLDLVAARALGGFPELLQWSRNALADQGHLVLWLGGEDAAMISNNAGWIWRPAVRIPDSQRRFILIGRPST